MRGYEGLHEINGNHDESSRSSGWAFKSSKRNSQVAVGEFDIVVADNANATCEIYEVKHSKEQAKEQYRHLMDEGKLKSTAIRYGKITKKVVIYRGENTTLENGIEYRNVEEYLKSLVWCKSERIEKKEQKTEK